MPNTCVVCEHQKKSGIYIVNSFICDSCEHKLISTAPTDDYYRYCIKKLAEVHHSLQLLREQA